MKKNKSKRILKTLLIVVSVCSLWFVPWILVFGWIRPLPDTIQEQVNEAIDQGFDGMIVYIDQGGKTPAFYSGGWKDREKKIAADPNSLFKIASISKLYVATAITKLIDQKKISLDETVADHFPKLASRIENSGKITIEMLVKHRSGIPNYTDTPGFWSNQTETSEEALSLILGKPANFAPNTDYEYCNTNYLLLSLVINQVTGQHHQEFIEEEIINPLKLNRTFKSIEEVDLADVMSGYHVDHPFDLKSDNQGMLASAEDVGIFIRALNDGTLLSNEEQKIYSSIYKFEHSGWVPGYQSFATYNSDLDAVIVQFYSTTDEKLYMWNLAEIINGRIEKILQKDNKKTE